MSIQNISNGKFVNFTTGDCRVTVIGEDISTHKLDVYSALVSVPESGVSLPIDNIIGRGREFNDIFNSKNSYAGSTSGQEMMVDKTTSLSLKDDYVYLSDQPVGVEFNKNALIGLLMNDKFEDGEGNYIKPAGTNGAIKRGRNTTRGFIFGELFAMQGRLQVPQATDADGNAITETNSRIAAMGISSLTVMLEFLYEYDENTKVGYRFVYAVNSNLNITEGDDANTLSMDTQLPCDVVYTDRYWIDGPNSQETGVFSDGVKQYAVVSGALAEGTEDSDAIDLLQALDTEGTGTATFAIGDIGIVYNTTAGAAGYMIYKCTTATDTGVASAVFTLQGAKINTTGTDVETDTVKDIYAIKDFNFSTSKFVAQ